MAPWLWMIWSAGVGLLAVGLVCALVFLAGCCTWRGALFGIWAVTALGVAAWYWGRLPWRRELTRPRQRALALLVVGWLGVLMGLAPGGAPSDVGSWGSPTLRFSPLNLVPEEELVRIGVRGAYPPEKARAVWRLTKDLYGEWEGPELETAVHYTLTDLLGLGTGSGHAYYYVPPHFAGERLPVLIFLHGAMGNFQCYLYQWREFAQRERWIVVCPTNGFGRWYRPGGVETVERARKFSVEQLPGDEHRVMLVGLSNGATGGVRAVAAHPDHYRALVLISPVLEPDRVTSRDFLVWADRSRRPLVIHGDADVNVSVHSVRAGVQAMRKRGVTVDFRLYPGQDHFLLFAARERVFSDLRAWLRAP
ncbi:MAG: prolyl oligopeptidase family serine peptidase [Armatimonadetes bacterium]|nr:prolyl oligopeptidase family serine peptidase [Armatimonadota bacterium]